MKKPKKHSLPKLIRSRTGRLYLPATTKFLPNLKFLSSGGSRKVYRWFPGWVLKVPKGSWGIQANANEVQRYQKYLRNKSKIRVAECYQWRNMVVMESVKVLKEPWTDSHKLEKVLNGLVPRWVSQVDCKQVGHNRQGHLVAFDGGQSHSYR